MAFVKICGIQTEAEAREALDGGATALGFLVGLTHRAEDAIGSNTSRVYGESSVYRKRPHHNPHNAAGVSGLG